MDKHNPAYKTRTFTSGKSEEASILNQTDIDRLGKLDEAFAVETGLQRDLYKRARVKARSAHRQHQDAEQKLGAAARYSGFAFETRDIANGEKTDMLDSAVKELKATYETIKIQNDVYGRDIKIVNRENQTFKEDNRDLMKARDNLTRELGQTRSRLEQLESLVGQSAQGTIQQLQSQIQQKNLRIQALENVTNLHTRLGGEIKELRQKISQKDSRIEELESASGETTRLGGEIQGRDSEIQRLRSHIQVLESASGETTRLQAQIREKDSEIQRLRSRIEELERTSGETTRLQAEIREKDLDIEQLQGVKRENSRLKSEVEEKALRVQHLEGVQKQKSQLEGEVEEKALRLKYLERVQETNVELRQQASGKDMRIKQLEGAQNESSGLRSQIQGLENQSSALELQNELLQRGLVSKLRDEGEDVATALNLFKVDKSSFMVFDDVELAPRAKLTVSETDRKAPSLASRLTEEIRKKGDLEAVNKLLVQSVKDTHVNLEQQARDAQTTCFTTTEATELLATSLREESMPDDPPREKLKSASLYDPKDDLVAAIDNSIQRLQNSATSANQSFDDTKKSLETATKNCLSMEKELDMISSVISLNPSFLQQEDMAEKVQSSATAVKEAAEKVLGEVEDTEESRKKLKSVSLYDPMKDLRNTYDEMSQGFNTSAAMLTANVFLEDQDMGIKNLLPKIQGAAETAQAGIDDWDVEEPRQKLKSTQLFNPLEDLRKAYNDVAEQLKTTASLLTANVLEDRDMEINNLLPKIQSAAETAQAGIGDLDDVEEPRQKLKPTQLYNPLENLRKAYDDVAGHLEITASLLTANVLEDQDMEINNLLPKIQSASEAIKAEIDDLDDIEEPRQKLKPTQLYNPLEDLRKAYEDVAGHLETTTSLLQGSKVSEEYDSQVDELLPKVQDAAKAVFAGSESDDEESSEPPRKRLTGITLYDPVGDFIETLNEARRQAKSANAEKATAESTTDEVRKQLVEAQSQAISASAEKATAESATNVVNEQLVEVQRQASSANAGKAAAESKTQEVRRELEEVQRQSGEASKTSRALESQLAMMANLIQINVPSEEQATQQIDGLLANVQEAVDTVKMIAATDDVEEREKLTGLRDVKPLAEFTADWKSLVQDADSQISGLSSMASAITKYADCFTGDESTEIQGMVEKVKTTAPNLNSVPDDEFPERKKLQYEAPERSISLATKIKELEEAQKTNSDALSVVVTLTHDLMRNEGQDMASQFGSLTDGLGQIANLDSSSDESPERKKLQCEAPERSISLAAKIKELEEAHKLNSDALSVVVTLTHDLMRHEGQDMASQFGSLTDGLGQMANLDSSSDELPERKKLQYEAPERSISLAAKVKELEEAHKVNDDALGTVVTLTHDLMRHEGQDMGSRINALTDSLGEMAKVDFSDDESEVRQKLTSNQQQSTITLASRIKHLEETRKTDDASLACVSSLALTHLPSANEKEKIARTRHEIFRVYDKTRKEFNENVPENTKRLTSNGRYDQNYISPLLRDLYGMIDDMGATLESAAEALEGSNAGKERMLSRRGR